MPCYTSEYTDKRGKHTCTKWGNTPEDALALMKKTLGGAPEIGKPVLVSPQPFSDESRALHERKRRDRELREQIGGAVAA